MTPLKLARLDSADADFSQVLDALTHWDISADDEVTRIAAEILKRVQREGDAALLELTARFDGVHADRVADLAIEAAELKASFEALPALERDALQVAAGRIRTYHERQLNESFSFEDDYGNRLGSRVLPLDRVGVYVPGGQAAYPSTVLMTVIPARVAGVQDVTVTVPTPDGARSQLLLAALYVASVDRVYTLGGAQAVAALAFGTETISKVDKIVGPGGAFVAAAKRLVFGPVGIDVIAGPSEILIIADGSSSPRWAALDLFSQAEHDATARAMLLSPDAGFLDAVMAQMQELIASMDREAIIRRSLADRGALIRTRDLAEAVEISNSIAPEHLELAVADPDALLVAVKHAGAIFLGAHSGETIGDYAAGPSHVLPTFGTARYASPLGVYDFQKRSSVIACTPAGAEALGRIASVLARGEGLEAHARAAEVRIAGFDHNG
ncbi:MAG: histidinol dehydrogenase [Gammaproteobacteria bacterium]|nr:MAG: histidinol dehydrogenase [Gammaproteobacteria bacterium]